ncbi:putative drug resistance transporter [Nocardia brasiliensis NBRC 14402]|uniref:MFS transporter n=1 Tax=Nocardia brasiliensis TaxID=37326 RepID=UPI00045CB0C5|nr:MFS transporter [Nocardia brasiliensis]ASF06100.1 MFS transporter [Nocardia brasiliensis]GAJ82433.1 putative drug resistance transporter [Nocardia brasiliensis NBRC 14402]
MLENPAAPTQYPVKERAFGLAILVLSGMQLMSVLDGTVMILVVPRLQADFGMSASSANWVITSYALTYAGLMLLGGRVGDAFGRKKMFLLGVGLFTLSSLLCGLAINGGMLIGMRALQGIGAAFASPTALALVATTFAPGKARNQAIAIFGAMVGVGSVGGLVVGGALADVWWRGIFLINVPIGLLVFVGAMRCLRDTEHHRLSLDVRGAVLATIGVATLVFGGMEGPALGWGHPVIIGSLVAGGVLLITFIIAERNVDNPLLPWSLFSSQDRVATFLAVLLASGVMGGISVFGAQYVQNVLGYSALQAGLIFIPFTIGMGVGGALTSKLVMRIAPRILIGAGGGLAAVALLFGSTLDRTANLPTLLVLFLVIGTGVGIVLVIVPLCLIVGVEVTEIGPLSAVGQMLLAFGPALALGFLGPVVVSRTLALGGSNTVKPSAMNTAQLDALSSGYTLALFLCGVGVVLTLLIALAIRYTAAQVAQAQHAQEEAQQS